MELLLTDFFKASLVTEPLVEGRKSLVIWHYDVSPVIFLF